MTVFQMKRSAPAYHQAQDWTGRFDPTVRYRSVVTGTPVRKGVRREVSAAILLAVLILFLCVLLADINTLHTASTQASQLSASITSLETSNSFLRSELSVALNHPVLRSQTEAQAPEIIQTILLTAGPAE